MGADGLPRRSRSRAPLRPDPLQRLRRACGLHLGQRRCDAVLAGRAVRAYGAGVREGRAAAHGPCAGGLRARATLGRGWFENGPFGGPLGNSRNVVYGRSKLHKTVVSRSGTIVLVYFVVWHCSKRNLSTVEKRLSAEGPLSMHMAGRWACGAKARERWQEGAVESTRREYCVCF